MTQDRKTAEELEIHPLEMEALLWVRDALDPAIPDKGLPEWMRFDMDSWIIIPTVSDDEGPLTKCGSACCIGGSMEVYLSGQHTLQVGDFVTQDQLDQMFSALSRLLGSQDDDAYQGSKNLYALFYKYGDNDPLDRGLAVGAIDNFLTGNVQDPWLALDKD